MFNHRQPAAAADDVSSVAEATMIEAEDPTSEVLPEVAAVQARLETIPPELVTEALVVEVVRAAERAAMTRKLAEVIERARAELSRAVGRQDIAEAMLAGDRLASAERVATYWPSGGPDAGVVAEAIEIADSKIRWAVAQLPAVPELTYAVKLAEYRAQDPRRQVVQDPPVPSQADIDAKRALAAYVGHRDRVLGGVRSWHAGVGQPGRDVLGLLQSAASHIDQIGQVGDEARRVADQVSSANRVQVGVAG
jgi:DNA-binding FrmR family transcriptional regulator